MGINYVIVTDRASYDNYVEMFQDFPNICQQYKTYFVGFPQVCASAGQHRFGQLRMIKDCFLRSLAITKISRCEDVDLILYPSEDMRGVLTSYLSSLFSSKPWTAIFQPGPVLNCPNLFKGTISLRPLNPFNILAHINQEEEARNYSLSSKIGLGIEFLLLLKIAEKTVILTVSESVVEDLSYLNPRIRILPIIPGNGIDLSEFSEVPQKMSYQGIFFGRMIPGKGFNDLIEIWKRVVKEIPHAKLAICGIEEDPKILQNFIKEVRRQKLDTNIEVLGQQDRVHLFDVIRKSYLTINPSYEDSFSLVILESLASGTPVVSYNLPACERNFSRCTSVLRCPVGDMTNMSDKILQTLTQYSREDLRVEAKRFAASYDLRNVVIAEKNAYILVKSDFKKWQCMRSKENGLS